MAIVVAAAVAAAADAVDSDVAWSTFLTEAKYFAIAGDSSSFEIVVVVVVVDETLGID